MVQEDAVFTQSYVQLRLAALDLGIVEQLMLGHNSVTVCVALTGNCLVVKHSGLWH